MKLTRKLIVAFSLLILVLAGFSIDNADANINPGPDSCYRQYDVRTGSGSDVRKYCGTCKLVRSIEFKELSKCPI